MNKKITAPEILRAGIGHMEDRAVTYDKPQGERSMGKTVAMMNVLIADKLKEPLSEEDGWNFMELLKLVRSKQGAFKADNYEERAAYGGLAGEAAWMERALMPELKKMHAPCEVCRAVFDGPCGLGGGDKCLNPKNAAPVNRQAVDPNDVDITLEPAAGIDDDSQRQQLIQQGGELAEHVYPAVDATKKEPERPRHLCLTCSQGHPTHECTAGNDPVPLAELAIIAGQAPCVEDCPAWATALMYHPQLKQFAWCGTGDSLPMLQWIDGLPVNNADCMALTVYAYIDENRKLSEPAALVAT